jgi:hypothetical protein
MNGEIMFNQMFEDMSKASESSFQLQQEMLRVWTQQWLSAPQSLGISAELARNLEKRWIELAIEMLNKHKEILASNYASGIQVIEQTFRLSEAKTSDDYQRMVEDLWRQLFKSSMDRSEAQMQECRKWAEKSFEMAQTSFNPPPKAQ